MTQLPITITASKEEYLVLRHAYGDDDAQITSIIEQARECIENCAILCKELLRVTHIERSLYVFNETNGKDEMLFNTGRLATMQYLYLLASMHTHHINYKNDNKGDYYEEQYE